MESTHSERTHVAPPHERQSADELAFLATLSILEHLRAHPRAADTLSGIAQWWLAPAGVSIPLDSLRCALDHLVESGVLETRVLPSSELLWFARETMLDDPTLEPGAESDPK